MSKTNSSFNLIIVALTVALGGFLMGFDASVISGAIKFINIEFELTDVQKGFAVACLTLTSTIAMLFAGPVSDKIGRKKTLIYAASLFFISAVYSALSPNYIHLIIARMIGGLGVGAALIVPPMYIAEIAPPKSRGRLVSFNQLNIVIGLSAAFFTNYMILQMGDSGSDFAMNLNIQGNNWRYMLALEALPAILYFLFLFTVPESPRWLAMRGLDDQAVKVMARFEGEENASKEYEAIKKSLKSDTVSTKLPLKELFKPAMKFVLTIGVVIAILQQITGINAVFFYAPMIFEQTGIGTDASFANAVIIGLTNLVFTIVAIAFVDRLGRKPLLAFGLAGIIITMFMLASGFRSAEYKLDSAAIAKLELHENYAEFSAVKQLEGTTFKNDVEFKDKVFEVLGDNVARKYESDILTAAITINSWLVLISIIGFVASFAVSLGPVMWILFSELFPDRLRGLAISFVGVINSAISFSVQQIFPWELNNIGSSGTYFIYGMFAVAGLVFVLLKIPETKGKSLEELEELLVKE
ncbi:MAG: sugar porter family MFS transporter [Bacteroidales bacterium]|nr:sugar porter family MFS transporter [Bacteroidales bacterium]MBN2820991.1 sugar porter family MFS transporter [Bacteroidales bacterium]